MEGECDGKFYIVDRENRCVVCGVEKDYSRYHVVPALYRTHFPEGLKSHRSHDIVLLCFHCHEKAANYQEVLKTQLAEEY